MNFFQKLFGRNKKQQPDLPMSDRRDIAWENNPQKNPPQTETIVEGNNHKELSGETHSAPTPSPIHQPTNLASPFHSAHPELKGHYTTMTGATKGKRRVDGQIDYWRKHTNRQAYQLHLHDLKERGANIVEKRIHHPIYGFSATVYYNYVKNNK